MQTKFKIKLGLRGKSIHWSSNDFLFYKINQFVAHSRVFFSIQCGVVQEQKKEEEKNLHIEQQKKLLRKKGEEGSVKGKRELDEHCVYHT